ncbi:uracil-DNA glycosylase family protein [Williamsia limnetica]|uniref:uracil-DNA glycosylase family protein n=1 Tax=Williamsia limnetica TaxID=882452 RepID=UPI000D7C63A9
MFRTCNRLGLARDKCAGWNICPFPTEGKNPSRAELERARPYTMRVLELLPKLTVVLLLGNPAQKGWESRFLRRRPDVEVILGASPSPPGINQKRNREDFESAIRRAVSVVERT